MWIRVNKCGYIWVHMIVVIIRKCYNHCGQCDWCDLHGYIIYEFLWLKVIHMIIKVYHNYKNIRYGFRIPIPDIYLNIFSRKTIPVPWDNLFSPILAEDRFNIDFISLGFRMGLLSRIKAQTPVIRAQAIELPDMVV